jgi:hypothetical protein
MLDVGEIDQTVYVCDGADGANGADGTGSLVSSSQEDPGANCEYGGQRIDVGADDGDGAGTAGDGVLHADEIDQTVYVCNGNDGADGADGASGADGTDGADGSDGGCRAAGASSDGFLLFPLAFLLLVTRRRRTR